MQHTWLIIVNPKSAGGKSKQDWPKIVALLEKSAISYQVIFTEYPRHATVLAQEGIENGYRKLVAVGGDGTISEVINGIMRQEFVPSVEVEFAAIPIGTGNDWVKTHKIPKDYAKNVLVLKEGKNIWQDIGKLTFHTHAGDVRYFNNVVGLAFDGFVADLTIGMNKSGFLGQFAYLGMIIKSLWKYKSTTLRIESEEFSYTGKVFCLNIGICSYSAGGMQTVPKAIFDDGLFDITVIEEMPRLRILWELRRLYLASIYGAKKVKFARTKKLSIYGVGNENSSIEADGEPLGEVPVTIEIIDKALKVRV